MHKQANIFISKDKKHIYIEFEYDTQIINLIKSIPSAKWNKEIKIWSISNKSNFPLLLIDLFTKNKVTCVCDSGFQKIYETCFKKEGVKNENIEKISQSKTIESKVDFSKFLKIDPFGYQKEDFNFLQSINGCGILGLEPGLGKSLEAITYSTYNKHKSIVICPASLKWNWESEINKFTDRTSRILNSNSKLEHNEKSDYLIINYELLIERKNKNVDKRKSTLLERLIWLIENGKYNCVIIDEAHRMKNMSAKSSKIIHKHFSKMQHKVLLTGTPIKSRPIEYFSLLKFIDKKRWNSKIEFAMRYCNPVKTRFGTDFSGSSNLEELYKETSPYIIRRLKSEVLKELPEKSYTIVPIHLTSSQETAYNRLEENIIDTIDDIVTNDQTDQELTKDQSETTLTNKQRMVAIGNIHKVKMFTSDIKLQAAIEIIKTIIDGGKKVVVFTQYLRIMDGLKKAFSEKAVLFNGASTQQQRKDAVISFQNDKNTCVFIGSIFAAGTGLTLTAADTTLFIDEPWTSADKIQAEDRIHRISQLNNVQIITLLCTNTIDEHINNLLATKRDILAQVLDNKRDTTSSKTSILNDLIKIYRKKRKKNS